MTEDEEEEEQDDVEEQVEEEGDKGDKGSETAPSTQKEPKNTSTMRFRELFRALADDFDFGALLKENIFFFRLFLLDASGFWLEFAVWLWSWFGLCDVLCCVVLVGELVNW